MLILLFLSSIATAIISAVTGMGGGILLLSFMTLILPIKIIIPIHGVVQLASNFSRSWYLRQDVRLSFLKFYLLGLPIGAFLAAKYILPYISAKYAYFLISALITYVIFKPKKMPSIKLNSYGWSIVGFLNGILALTIGAVGPFLAAFYVRPDLNRKEVIATKAAMQTFTHFIKIPAFLFMSFNYFEYKFELIWMVIGVLIGTKLGVILLEKMKEGTFKIVFKACLSLALVRILYKAITL